MKIRVEIDCTPLEARKLMGLPDVEPLHQAMMAGMQGKVQDAMKLMEPENLMKQWAPIGLQSLEQFQKLLWGAARGLGEAGGRSGGTGESKD